MQTISESKDRVSRFIASEWSRTIRRMEERTDEFPLLPKPFVVPCADHGFRSFYYWDSFYASIGLLLQGRVQEVLDVAENMRWLVEHYGYVPNFYEAGHLYRSQPPHYGLLIGVLHNIAPGKINLEAHLAALTREYAFWTVFRVGEGNLNRYGHHATPSELMEFGDMVESRLPRHKDDVVLRLGDFAHYLAEAESGWDFTSRFELRCADHLPVDLNSLLYGHECVCAELSDAINDHNAAALWRRRMTARRCSINDFLWSPERQAFVDYDSRKGLRSVHLTAASFYPLWLGIATREQASGIAGLVQAVEAEHGVLSTEPYLGLDGLQWDAPNAWPPLQMVAILGLLRYGFEADARRLAKKWVCMNERIFDETGRLWEKYNAISGTLEVRNEYPMPSMMGWSAGAYLLCNQVMQQGERGLQAFYAVGAAGLRE